MAIARQRDSIWALGAMGEGRQHHERSDTHDRSVHASHSQGRAMGERHAHEAWRTEHRDERGRFAPTPEHHKERFEEEGRQQRGEHRDAFIEGYHTGFTSASAKKEQEGKKKESSFLFRVAVDVDPFTHEVDFNDGLDEWDRKYLTREQKEDRYRYKLQHGTYKGWQPETINERYDRTLAPEDQYESGPDIKITDRNPGAAQLATLANYAKRYHNVGLTGKFPFSARSYASLIGAPDPKKSRARGNLPTGSLASDPMETVDANGVKHTFWHQISTEFPVDNPKAGQPGEPSVIYQTEYPGSKMSKNAPPRLTVAMHHFRSDTGLQPPMVSNHPITFGDQSQARDQDLQGLFRTNDQTRLLHQLGVQRVGDWKNQIQFIKKDPLGHIKIERVNGDDSRYPGGGPYYDPDLGSKELLRAAHPDYVGEKWYATPVTMERRYPFDPSRQNEMMPVTHNRVEFPADENGFNSMIDYVRDPRTLGDLAPSYMKMPQNHQPNEGGLPPSRFNPHTGSIRPWQPEHNIHRSAERLPLW